MVLSKHTRTQLINRNGKKVRAHRWIMEQHIGRKLDKFEYVHHINGNPLDNRIENLSIVTPKKHQSIHLQKYPDYKKCVECGSEFKANPRKRKRQKCCSKECAQKIRVRKAMQARGYDWE